MARAAAPVVALRLAAVLLLVIAALGLAAGLTLLTPEGRRLAVRGWFRLLLRACGVRLVVAGADGGGEPSLAVPGAPTGTLVTANHVSWLDIAVLMAVEPLRLLAKGEVRRWPLLGPLAARAGTVFIDRGRLRSLPATVAEIAAALRGGQTVAVFPQGSTWCGRTTGRFYPATLQAALDAGAPVRPVAIRYRLADGSPTTLPAFVGEDTLVASLARVLAARGVVTAVELGAPLRARSGPGLRPLAATVRRELAAAAEATVIAAVAAAGLR